MSTYAVGGRGPTTLFLQNGELSPTNTHVGVPIKARAAFTTVTVWVVHAPGPVIVVLVALVHVVI